MVVFTSSLQLDLYCLLALSFLILAQFESLPMKGHLIAELHVFHSIQVAIPGIKKRHHKWLMTRATFSIYTSYHWSLGPLSFIQVRSQDDFVGEKIDSVGRWHFLCQVGGDKGTLDTTQEISPQTVIKHMSQVTSAGVPQLFYSHWQNMQVFSHHDDLCRRKRWRSAA